MKSAQTFNLLALCLVVAIAAPAPAEDGAESMLAALRARAEVPPDPPVETDTATPRVKAPIEKGTERPSSNSSDSMSSSEPETT